MGRKLQNSFPKNTLYFISLPILSYFFLHKQKVTKLEIEKKKQNKATWKTRDKSSEIFKNCYFY